MSYLFLIKSLGTLRPYVCTNVIEQCGDVYRFYQIAGEPRSQCAIGISGQASIDKVAGPVGEALIMTALGLAVAVPAVLGYNWLIRRNKSVMEQVRGFGAELHAVLLSSPKVAARA